MKTLTIGFALLSLAVHAQSVPSKKSVSGTARYSDATQEKSATIGQAKAKPEVKVGEEEAVNEGPSTKKEKREAAVTSIEPEALVGFEHYAPQLQQLIRDALALTKLNLTYTFGASNPKQGGMDCSGTIWYLLNGLGLKGVPRQSNEMAGWVQSNTLLHRTLTATSLKDPEFAALQPGDLLFWSGTYETSPRKIPVTHVMLYLGKLKKSGKAVVFGASDGRVYQGERRTGVSVFDFSVPSEGSASSFYGYGLIPGVGRIEVNAPAPPPEPVIAKVPPVITKSEPTIAKELTVKPVNVAMKEDIRPAVGTEPIVVEKPAIKEKPAVAASSSGTSGSKAKSSKSSSAPQVTTGAKAKSSVTTKPAVKKKAPPPPTPQEQIGKAAKKVASSIKGLFSS